MAGNKVSFYHAHTNSTLLSAQDCKLLVNENVEKVAVKKGKPERRGAQLSAPFYIKRKRPASLKNISVR